jgi:hypothetical protein
MNSLECYDEITRLRLRLAEVELQRDAFKAMANKAVTELIREALAKQPLVADWSGIASYTYDPTPPAVRKPKPSKPKRRGKA